MTELQYITNKINQGIFSPEELNQIQQVVEVAKNGLADLKLSPEFLDVLSKCTKVRNKGDTLTCPKCGGVWVVKNGRRAGRQRYLCKDCSSTFGDTYGTIFYRSRLSLSTWKKLIELSFYGQSLKTMKRDLNINLSTALLNRHKLYGLIGQQAPQHKFHSITEADEYYTPTSYQGIRNPQFFIEKLGRMPRHRRSLAERIEYIEKAGYEVQKSILADGTVEMRVYKNNKSIEIEGLTHNLDMDLGTARREAILVNGLSSPEKRKRGISKEQVCVLSVIDREQNIYLNPVCSGRVTEKTVTKHLKHRVESDAIFVTDKHIAYRGFCRNYHISLRQIPSDKHTQNGYSLSRVNSLHSRLATYMRNRSQVGTRHLDSYLNFFQWADRIRNEETMDKITGIIELMTQPMKPMKRSGLHSKAYPFGVKGIA